MGERPGTERKCKRCQMGLVFLEGQSGPERPMPAQKVRGIYRREGDRVVKVELPPGTGELFVNHYETCPHAGSFSRSGSRREEPEQQPPPREQRAGLEVEIDQGRLALFDHDVAERLKGAGIRAAFSGAEPSWRERSLLALWDCARARRYFIVDQVWLYIPTGYETPNNRAIGGTMTGGASRGWVEIASYLMPIPSARKSSHHNERKIWRSRVYVGSEPDDGGHGFRAAYVEEVAKIRDRARRRRGDES